MGSTTIIAINNDKIHQLKEDSDYFFDRVIKGMSSRIDDEENLYETNGIKVFHSVYRGGEGNSRIYLFDGHNVHEMDLNSNEMKKDLAKHPDYVRKMIEVMKGKIGELEKALTESQMPVKK